MPLKRSAKKELRKNIKRRKRNLLRKKKVKELIKKFQLLVQEKKIEEAREMFPSIQKAIDKLAKSGIIKKNTASRKKSRLASLLKKTKIKDK